MTHFICRLQVTSLAVVQHPASKMKPTSLSLSAFAALVASALAADCTGNFLGSPTTDLYWEVRTRMCDQNAPFACPYQQDCQQGAQAKFDTFTFSVQLIRKHTDGVKGFKDCWVRDAPLPR